MSTNALMTVEQFARMETAETEDYELVEGKLIPLSSGTPKHNMVRDHLGSLFWSYFRGNPIGTARAGQPARLVTSRLLTGPQYQKPRKIDPRVFSDGSNEIVPIAALDSRTWLC